MGKTCSECKEFYEARNLEYCPACGGELELKCPYCGEDIEEFYTYCGYCRNEF